MEVSGWETPKHERWEGPLNALIGVVERHVTVGTFGNKEPESGYLFTVSGISQQIGLHVQVSAGSQSTGRRIPLHSLTVDLRELVSGGVTGPVGDTLCAAVAETWKPLTLSLSDPLVNRAARRGGWKIPVGYRTWVNAEVGTIRHTKEGLASCELAGGTLLSAPDDWPADRSRRGDDRNTGRQWPGRNPSLSHSSKEVKRTAAGPQDGHPGIGPLRPPLSRRPGQYRGRFRRCRRNCCGRFPDESRSAVSHVRRKLA